MIFLICACDFSGSENASAPPQQVNFLLVLIERLCAHGLGELVEVFRILERLTDDAERPVGLAADVAGDLDAVQRLLHRLGQLVVAEVLDQHLDHVADRLLAFVVEAGVLRGYS